MKRSLYIFISAAILLLSGCGGMAEVSSAPPPSIAASPSPVATPTAILPTEVPADEPIVLPEPAPTPFEATDTPAPSAVLINISDPAMYKKLNIFFSNFSETRFSYGSSFSVEKPDLGTLTGFLLGHIWLNNQSKIEEPLPHVTDANLCISKKTAVATWNRFFGDALGSFSDGDAQRISDDDPYYYFSITNDYPAYGVTLLDKVTDLGENLFQADFHIYETSYGYDAGSGSFYTATPETIATFFPRGITAKAVGSATFEAVEQADGKMAFQLRTYERTEDPNAQSWE